MNRLVDQILAYFLLLCISVIIVPFNLFHHHDDEIHCNISDAEYENDLCHISIYHRHEVEKNHCEHDAHINENRNSCEFCEFITSQRHTYIVNEKHNSVSKLSSKTLLIYGYKFTPKLLANLIFSRGPPA